jgi:hypothetical protein
MGFVIRLLLAWYGRTFNGNKPETDVTVGVTVVQLLKPNQQRFWVSFSNNGAATVVISKSQVVTATTGWPIPAGGTLGFSWLGDGDISTEGWFGISAGAGNGVHIIEQIASGEDESRHLSA